MGRGGWGPRPASSHGGSPLVPAGPSQVCMRTTQSVVQFMSLSGSSPTAAPWRCLNPFEMACTPLLLLRALVFNLEERTHV